VEKSILDQLREEYESFTGAEKKIADYILSNRWECQGLGIAELSGECGVAVSTVSVFCRKLGLGGFNDFKIELARANTLSSGHRPASLDNTEPERGDSTADILHKACVRSQEILSRSHHMLLPEQLDRAVELLRSADQVLILGQGNHSAVAALTWAQFSLTSSRFKTVADSHFQTIALSTLSKNDVVIYFSFTGSGTELTDAVELIRNAGAKLILVTRFGHCSAAEFADAVLVYGADEGPAEFGCSDALISQLYVVESLLWCYRLRCADSCAERKFANKNPAQKML